MTSHEMARKLLAGPDLILAIENDGECLAGPRDPVIAKNAEGREFVVIDSCGESYGRYPTKEHHES